MASTSTTGTPYALLKGLDDLLNPKPKSPSVLSEIGSLGLSGVAADVTNVAQLFLVRGAFVFGGFVFGVAGLAMVVGSLWGSKAAGAIGDATTPVATVKAAATAAA